MSAKQPAKVLVYRFRWKGGEREFEVRLSSPGMRLETTPRASYPDWTRLDYEQCPNCPLKPADTPRCPVAVSLVDLLELFNDCLSTEIAEVSIVTADREYRKTMAVQDGLSSLMGLYMATAGCPILDRLRPMVYTHLPFANLKETIYRALSMYLVAQFLLQKRGQEPDWDLKNLRKLYEDIARVNRAFAKRLVAVSRQDANMNALVKLDCLAGFAVFSIEKNYVQQLEATFAPYLTKST